MSRSITAGCLFGGMGGFSVALQRLGVKMRWCNEIDDRASQTFHYNHPKIRHIQEDVRQIFVRANKLEPVNILTAGFPCQSFSQAGRKKGFNDERGQLFFEIPRLIKEFGDKRPAIVVLENVPYLMHGEGGQWIAEVIRQIQLAGYWFGSRNCQVLNTAEVSDIPQNRPRLFMVAVATNAFSANPFRFPQPTSSLASLDKFVIRSKKADNIHYLNPENRYFKAISKKLETGNPGHIYQLRRFYVRENDKGLCPTLTANMGDGGHNVPFIKDEWGIRRLTVEECCRLQGFEDNVFPEDIPLKDRYKLLGNTVTIPVAEKLMQEAVKHVSSRCA